MRQLLATAGGGFGLVGLAALLHSEGMLETAVADSGPSDLAGMLVKNPMAPASGASSREGQTSHLVLRERRARATSTPGTTSPALARWDGKSMNGVRPVVSRTRPGSSRTPSAD